MVTGTQGRKPLRWLQYCWASLKKTGEQRSIQLQLSTPSAWQRIQKEGAPVHCFYIPKIFFLKKNVPCKSAFYYNVIFKSTCKFGLLLCLQVLLIHFSLHYNMVLPCSLSLFFPRCLLYLLYISSLFNLNSFLVSPFLLHSFPFFQILSVLLP